MPQETARLVGDLVEIDCLDKEIAAAGIGEHLAREIRGALAGTNHLVQRLTGRVPGRNGIQDEAGAAHDAHQ